MIREVIKESASGVKLSNVLLNGEIFYIVDFPLVLDELSCDNFELFRNYDEASLCYESFKRGYEYAKAN